MIDPANASKLAQIAREVGAAVCQGALRYPSGTGGWLVGDLDFCEYLDRYRNQQVMVIIAPIGPAPTSSYTCGVCGLSTTRAGSVRAANWRCIKGCWHCRTVRRFRRAVNAKEEEVCTRRVGSPYSA